MQHPKTGKVTDREKYRRCTCGHARAAHGAAGLDGPCKGDGLECPCEQFRDARLAASASGAVGAAGDDAPATPKLTEQELIRQLAATEYASTYAACSAVHPTSGERCWLIEGHAAASHEAPRKVPGFSRLEQAERSDLVVWVSSGPGAARCSCGHILDAHGLKGDRPCFASIGCECQGFHPAKNESSLRAESNIAASPLKEAVIVASASSNVPTGQSRSPGAPFPYAGPGHSRSLLDALMAGMCCGCHRYVSEQLRRAGADAARIAETVLDLIRREEDRLADEEVRHG